MPRCIIEAINLHLADARAATAGVHAVLQLDQAGCHMTQMLIVPANVALLPARSHELSPAESLWQLILANCLGNRIFVSYEAVLDHCCDAWDKLIDQPRRIMSIGLRAWAHGF